MDRQESRLGCLVAVLGIVLGVCVLPYLISSIYSIANTVWQAGGAANWLWGDWINSWVGEDRILYMLLSEGPMCCVGAIVVLIVAVGLVSHFGVSEPQDTLEDETLYEVSEEWESDQGVV